LEALSLYTGIEHVLQEAHDLLFILED